MLLEEVSEAHEAYKYRFLLANFFLLLIGAFFEGWEQISDPKWWFRAVTIFIYLYLGYRIGLLVYVNKIKSNQKENKGLSTAFFLTICYLIAFAFFGWWADNIADDISPYDSSIYLIWSGFLATLFRSLLLNLFSSNYNKWFQKASKWFHDT